LLLAFGLENELSGLKTSHNTENGDFTEQNNTNAETDITISVLDKLK
jgi:hypothetical protein